MNPESQIPQPKSARKQPAQPAVNPKSKIQNPIASLFLVLLLLPASLGGCAYGELAALNPYVRKKWQEDEQYGPTYHARLARMRSLQSGIERLPPADQERLAAEMSYLLQEEEFSHLRREAVIVLGRLSTPAAMPPLRAALADSDPEIRIAACRAWGGRGGEDAAAALAQVVGSDQDLDVRLAATAELGRFDSPLGRNALALALDDSNPALQHRAARSLASSTGRNYGDNIVLWREFLRGDPPPEAPSMVERLKQVF